PLALYTASVPFAPSFPLSSSSVLAFPPPLSFFFFNDTAPPEISTLSLHDALPIWAIVALARPSLRASCAGWPFSSAGVAASCARSEEHTSELQSLTNLVCRLLLEKKKQNRDSSQARRGASRRACTPAPIRCRRTRH